MNFPKTSIIIPFHNSDTYISKTLWSIVHQTIKSIEILLVNDNSTDNTEVIIKSFNDKRIKIINVIGNGASDAYNTGVNNADSEYVLFLDHDDIAHPKLLEEKLKLLAEFKVDIIGSFYNIIDTADVVIKQVKLPIFDSQIKEFMRYQCVIQNSGSLVRRDLFLQNNGFFKEKFPAQDYDFYLRVLNNATFYNIPKYLISWRINPASPSQKQFNQQKSVAFSSLKTFFWGEYKANSIRKSELLFLMGRASYYHESVMRSIPYFSRAIFCGNLKKKNLIFLLKSLLLFIPIKYYRDWLSKKIYKKEFFNRF
jgi:glycosyltransferase involved in cell wall biosynthesis